MLREHNEGNTDPAAAGNQWGDINQVVREYNGFGESDPTTANTSLLEQYADVVFSYDGSGRVVRQTLLGAGASSSDSADGRGEYGYVYNLNPAHEEKRKPAPIHSSITGFNAWAASTLVSLPGGASETVYSNLAGQMMLSDVLADGLHYRTFHEHDDKGRVTLVAHPSAVAGNGVSSAHLDLLGGSGDQHYAGLKADEGLIELYEYDHSSVPEGYLYDIPGTFLVSLYRRMTSVVLRARWRLGARFGREVAVALGEPLRERQSSARPV